MALVITLIMLAVVTFLAVAFLATSRRERGSVTVTIEQTDAKLMADTASARGLAQVFAQMLAHGSLLNYDMIVSTNADGAAFPYTNTFPFLVDPRPPVFVDTNRPGGTFPLDFRYYLDFNRNGTNEPPVNGPSGMPGDPEWVGVLDRPGLPHSSANRFVGRIAYLVMPAGKSLDLNMVHNQAKPLSLPPAPADRFYRNHGFGPWEFNLAAFFRELNPNVWTTYGYLTNTGLRSIGNSFDDANDLINYRYKGNYTSLATVFNLYGLPGTNGFATDLVDGFANGPLMSGLGLPAFENDNNILPFVQPWPHWPGSPSPTNFYDVTELFGDTRTNGFTNFVVRLRTAMTNTSPNLTNRNTFYRLLAQMGVDSAPPTQPKLVNSLVRTNNQVTVVVPAHGLTTNDHVRILGANATNYNGTYEVASVTSNAFTYFLVPSLLAPLSPATGIITAEKNNQIHLNYNNQLFSQTSFTNWAPLDFFNTVADRLLRTTNFGVTNINVYTNFGVNYIPIYDRGKSNAAYAAEIHHLLQLAANLFDATGNRSGLTPDFPSVFRPHFASFTNGDLVVITGYSYETNTSFLSNTWRDLSDSLSRSMITSNDNIYGTPLVVGAKKGCPNFNEFSFQSVVEVTRKLEFLKSNAADVFPRQTNQMIIVGITNSFGVEAWNSYTNTFPRQLNMIIINQAGMVLSNEFNQVLMSTNVIMANTTNITPAWFGTQFINNVSDVVFMPNMVYLSRPPGFYFTNLTPATFDTGRGFPVPQLYLTVSNKLRFFLTDVLSNRIVDVVNITNVQHINITSNLAGSSNIFADPSGSPGRYWLTNRVGSSGSVFAPTLGITNQIATATNYTSPDWSSFNATPPVNSQIMAASNFLAFLTSTNFNTNGLRMQCPFNPSRRFGRTISLEANDPLVHYTLADLTDPTSQLTNNVDYAASVRSPVPRRDTLGKLNNRYSPWGGRRMPNGPPLSTAEQPDFYDLSMKDPLVRWSDEWDFPTNRFGSIGWLGRVHRGTPWQTIYLKATVANLTNWFRWSGIPTAHPTNDWKLADLFIVATDPHAQRGLLSVNQTNIAAWSALLSGVPVLTNGRSFYNGPVGAVPPFTDLFIEPLSRPMLDIYEGIQHVRMNLPGQVFSNLASFLAVPELSAGTTVFGAYTNSPFLNGVGIEEKNKSINDVAYERLPQQILSLIQAEENPRLVIYAWGQSLKPAEHSIIVNPLSPNFQLCTNYQITGEVATRTVLRLEGSLDKNPKAVIESYTILPNP